MQQQRRRARQAGLATILAVSLVPACGGRGAGQPPAEPTAQPGVVLDGASLDARWDDGDTFSATGPDGERIKARLAGYNTLESYGPVHRWGDWTAEGLYATAKEAGDVAGASRWECTEREGGGGYGRVLVDCPGLRTALLERGLAHVFALEEAPDAADLATQQRAIEAGVGMWAKGAPSVLVTSLHSQDESDKPAYNRVCSTSTGMCEAREHDDDYETCQEVCVEDGCLLYVPYQVRYGDDRADCLR